MSECYLGKAGPYSRPGMLIDFDEVDATSKPIIRRLVAARAAKKSRQLEATGSDPALAAKSPPPVSRPVPQKKKERSITEVGMPEPILPAPKKVRGPLRRVKQTERDDSPPPVDESNSDKLAPTSVVDLPVAAKGAATHPAGPTAQRPTAQPPTAKPGARAPSSPSPASPSPASASPASSSPSAVAASAATPAVKAPVEAPTKNGTSRVVATRPAGLPPPILKTKPTGPKTPVAKLPVSKKRAPTPPPIPVRGKRASDLDIGWVDDEDTSVDKPAGEPKPVPRLEPSQPVREPAISRAGELTVESTSAGPAIVSDPPPMPASAKSEAKPSEKPAAAKAKPATAEAKDAKGKAAKAAAAKTDGAKAAAAKLAAAKDAKAADATNAAAKAAAANVAEAKDAKDAKAAKVADANADAAKAAAAKAAAAKAAKASDASDATDASEASDTSDASDAKAATVEEAAKAPPGAAEAADKPESLRAKGSDTVLPANPLGPLGDHSLKAFVESGISEADSVQATAHDAEPVAEESGEGTPLLWIVGTAAAVLVVGLGIGYALWGGGDDEGKAVVDVSADTKPADTKPADTKPADPVLADTKPAGTTPVDSKPADAKPSDTALADAKPADTTPADAKPADAKPVDTKPADTKPVDPEATGAVAVGGDCQLVLDGVSKEASVSIGSRKVGVGVGPFGAPCGDFDLNINHPRYKPFSKRVSLAAGDEPLRVRMQRPVFKLRVRSSPAGARVTVGGRSVGKTPVIVSVTGFQSVRVKVTKPGYMSNSKRVYAKKDRSVLIGMRKKP